MVSVVSSGRLHTCWVWQWHAGHNQADPVCAIAWLFDQLQASLSYCWLLWIATPAYMWGKPHNKVQDATGSGLDQFLSWIKTDTYHADKSKSKVNLKFNSSPSSFSKVSATHCDQESFFISNRLAAASFFGIRVILKNCKITNFLANSWCVLIWIYDKSLIGCVAYIIYYTCKSYCNGSLLDITFLLLLLILLILYLFNLEK